MNQVKKFVAFFYAKQVSLEDLLSIEKNMVNAKEWGQEVNSCFRSQRTIEHMPPAVARSQSLH